MKSSRGIQEHQVWAAADALIAAGERPTIERVRQKLGSGSPNTVSPMLDSWFKTLPGRLGVKAPTEEEAGYRMPADVVASAKALWDTARMAASELARETVAAQRLQLDQRTEALAIAEDELRKKQVAFAEIQVSLEAALLKANETINGLERQLEGARQRQATLETQIDQVRSALSAAQADQQRLRDEHSAAMTARDQADRHREERHDAQQKRSLLEIDRAREEARRSTAASAKEAARAAETERRLMESREEATVALRTAEQETLVHASRLIELNAALTALNAQRAQEKERMAELERELAAAARLHPAKRNSMGRASASPAAARRMTIRR